MKWHCSIKNGLKQARFSRSEPQFRLGMIQYLLPNPNSAPRRITYMPHSQKNIEKISPVSKKWRAPGIFAGGLAIGIGLSVLVAQAAKSEGGNCISSLELIKPTLDCGISDQKQVQMSNLQNKLDALIPVYVQSGQADRIGVFVRDLKSTRFAGVNEGDSFVMASLLKAPLLIAGYKLAEVEPKILDQEIIYEGKPNLYDEQSFKLGDQLVIGQRYSLRELMRRSIVFSDNTAAELLDKAYPVGFFDMIMKALGVQVRIDGGNDENLTTPRTYANIFRSLYNASYLTREYSNEALEMLAQTEYRNGAVAKLPPSTRVAHKFAERTVIDSKTQKIQFRQLHECGLVYADRGEMPYTFCIMSEGQSFESLEKIQREISLEIYKMMMSDAN